MRPGIYSPAAPMLGVAIALVCGLMLCRLFGAPKTAERHLAIDGLRGYLALSVFFCHASVWYVYVRTGQWSMPNDGLFRQLGLASVSLFFMVTAYLFTSRVARDAGAGGTDWIRLYVSRVCRLWPLYLAMVACIGVIVGWVSGWRQLDPMLSTLKHLAVWSTFCILGTPELNQVQHTRLIVAGAVWTLPYEWYFYLCLPLISRLYGAKVSISALLLVPFAAMLFLWTPIDRTPPLAFLGGIAGVYACRSERFKRFSAGIWGSVASVALLVLAYRFSDCLPNPVPLIALSGFFCLTVSGCSLFGLLTAAPSRLLGEISYSVYLLHGIVLYVAFKLSIGPKLASSLTPTEHWGVVVALVPVLVAVCYASFRFIEAPAMAKAGAVANRVKSIVHRAN